ncbi:MAG: GNAT family N-acetyltransferase [Actinomycetes bacterium]
MTATPSPGSSPGYPADVGLPAGSTVRPCRLDDADEVMAVMAASSLAAIGEPDVTRDEVLESLTAPTMDLVRDTWLVHDVNGQVAAFAMALDAHPDRAFIDFYLHPDLDDPTYRAVGGWVAATCLARIREQLRESGRPSVQVSSGSYADETRQIEVLTDVGLSLQRVYWRMKVVLDPDSPIVVDRPEGFTARILDADDDDDRRLAVHLMNETFREHHGFVEHTFEQVWEKNASSPVYDPTQWWVGELEAVPVGLLVGDQSRTDEGAGYVPTLGVLPPFRGRGVARALLQTAFEEFRRRGLTAAMLGVDSENTTGATALYESVGMRPTMAINFYETVVSGR